MTMKRRTFLQSLMGLAGAGIRFPAPVISANPRMNVLLVVVDDLGWSDLGCYGSDLHETPHIDGFANENLRFTQAYAASPVCTPTRASIMTGMSPARLNMTVWREEALQRKESPGSRRLAPPITETDLPLEAFTLAELFKQAGYQTGHIGKWHLGDAEHYPETQGFDVNIGGTLWGAPSTYWYPYRGGRQFGEFRYVPHLEYGSPGEYLTDRLTQEAIRFMNVNRENLFFLQLAYYTVHTPLEAKPDYLDYFRSRIRPDMKHQNARYAAMVRSLDENLGVLLQSLDEMGISNHTVVWLVSDNGGYINRHKNEIVTSNAPLRSGKGSLYEGGIRVPMVVRWPGHTPQGELCHEPVVSPDLFCTFAEYLDYRPDQALSPTLDGESLYNLLSHPERTLDRDTLFWHYPHYYPTWETDDPLPNTTPCGAVRKGDWKLIEFFEDNRIELYRLSTDLSEQTNLADTLPDTANELLTLLKRWRHSAGAKLPSPHP